MLARQQQCLLHPQKKSNAAGSFFQALGLVTSLISLYSSLSSFAVLRLFHAFSVGEEVRVMINLLVCFGISRKSSFANRLLMPDASICGRNAAVEIEPGRASTTGPSQNLVLPSFLGHGWCLAVQGSRALVPFLYLASFHTQQNTGILQINCSLSAFYPYRSQISLRRQLPC